MACYLLHFDPAYKGAGHYLGYTQDVEKRFALHKRGRGSPLVAAAVAAGCAITLARVWNGPLDSDGNAEQDMKRWKNNPRLCPICKARKQQKPSTPAGVPALESKENGTCDHSGPDVGCGPKPKTS